MNDLSMSYFMGVSNGMLICSEKLGFIFTLLLLGSPFEFLDQPLYFFPFLTKGLNGNESLWSGLFLACLHIQCGVKQVLVR